MASLKLDGDEEVLTLRFAAGSIDGAFGGADYVQRQLQQQIDDIKRRQILQKYADLPLDKLVIADTAAQAELAKQ